MVAPTRGCVVNFRLAPVALLLISQALPAQDGQPPSAQRMRIPLQDGGTREVLESIVVPALINAPFTLTLQTEWIKAFADGGTQTLINQRRIARDASGRIYQERWALVPKAVEAKSVMTFIQIADPNRQQLYTCSVFNKTCELTRYTAQPVKEFKPQLSPIQPDPARESGMSRETLGEDVIQGLQVTGVRETTNVAAGAMGNDRPLIMTREFWFSPKLGLNLISKRTDPRFGSQTFIVSELEDSQPDPALFQPPEGFKITDLRKIAPPSD